MTDDRSAVPAQPGEVDIAATGIDITVPHSARIWNYWLGGKDNFAVDRAAGDAWTATFPDQIAITVPLVTSLPAASTTWRRTQESGSSSTSAPGCRQRTTP